MRSLSKTSDVPVGAGLRSTLPCQKSFADAVVPGVEALIATGDGGGRYFCRLRDLIHQALIDEPPTQTIRQLVRELGTPAAILPLHRNDPDHACPLRT